MMTSTNHCQIVFLARFVVVFIFNEYLRKNGNTCTDKIVESNNLTMPLNQTILTLNQFENNLTDISENTNQIKIKKNKKLKLKQRTNELSMTKRILITSLNLSTLANLNNYESQSTKQSTNSTIEYVIISERRIHEHLLMIPKFQHVHDSKYNDSDTGISNETYLKGKGTQGNLAKKMIRCVTKATGSIARRGHSQSQET